MVTKIFAVNTLLEISRPSTNPLDETFEAHPPGRPEDQRAGRAHSTLRSRVSFSYATACQESVLTSGRIAVPTFA
jgi:hypothetical protein